MSLKYFFYAAGIFFFLLSCNKTEKAQSVADFCPDIFPDYTFTAIPRNIAPLNFGVKDAKKISVDFYSGDNLLFTVTGKKSIHIPADKWQTMLEQHRGSDIQVAVSVWNDAHPEGLRYKPFSFHISLDVIDKWIAYRLIEPGYEQWNAMGIYQRNLTSFTEKTIADNSADKGKCLNCHSFANYYPGRLIFHVRGKNGGTALWIDGKLEKIEPEKTGPKKAATYPIWHPEGRYIAFSSNLTRQAFLSEGEKPIEVYDLESDIIIYDTYTKAVINDSTLISADRWETFPAWSPDGKWLYYCEAQAIESVPESSTMLHYNLCRIAFDEATGRFGTVKDTVYNAVERGGSISFPRISPDGHYLLCTKSGYGTFPIWHDEADLMLIDISDGEEYDATTLNSNKADSYHSWSSNGRWIIFSSRRIDGRYTRLYIAWFDEDGNLHKPFLLPQRDPEDNTLRMKSYNIPEFVTGETVLPQRELHKLFFSNP